MLRPHRQTNMNKIFSKPLSELVELKYSAAKASSSLSFASSSLAILHTESGLPFQLRYCPSLAKKPLPKADKDAVPKKKPNPFENPDPALFITDLPPNTSEATHFLLLNKFPIIPSHFLLVTKVNKPQTAVLEPEDLAAAYDCLRTWENGHKGQRLYGFFNSGEHSGASQPHRHLQFVPVNGMREGDEKGEWDVLMDRIVDGDVRLTFEVFWEPVSPNTTKEELYGIYNRLYGQAYDAVKRFVEQHPSELELHDTNGGASAFSYNLGLTTKALMLIPRRREGTSLKGADGSNVGFAAFNGTVLAGTMMVKNQKEWELLQGNDSLLDQLLQDIGIPRLGTVSKETRM